MSALKLFMLRQFRGGAPVKDDNGIVYYANKQDAKKDRVGSQCISYGVDHRRFNVATQGKVK